MGLRDFFRRKGSARAEKVDAAYREGRAVGSEFAEQMKTYVDRRCAPVEEKFLSIFRERLEQVRRETEHSPILLARAEYSIFIKQVRTLTEEVTAETKAVLSEWDALHDAMGNKEFIHEKIGQYVENRLSGLLLTGLDIFMKNADDLKAADDRWRSLFPELAEQEPLDG